MNKKYELASDGSGSINIMLISRQGHEEYAINFEDAVTLCQSEMTKGRKWLVLKEKDGSSNIITDISFFQEDVATVRHALESAEEVSLIQALVGGSGRSAALKAWATRRRAAQSASKPVPKTACNEHNESAVDNQDAWNSLLREIYSVRNNVAVNTNRTINYKVKLSYDEDTSEKLVIDGDTITINLTGGRDGVAEIILAFYTAVTNAVMPLFSGKETIK